MNLHPKNDTLFICLCLTLIAGAAFPGLGQAPSQLLEEAHTLHQKGLDADQRGDYSQAIQHYGQALGIRKKALFDYKDTSEIIFNGIIKGYFNMGESYYRLTEYGPAEAYYDSCQIIQDYLEDRYQYQSDWRRFQLNHGIGQLFLEIAGKSTTQLALNTALLYLDNAEDISADKKTRNKAKVYTDLSAMHIKWESPSDSILYYAQLAHQLYEKLLLQYPGNYKYMRGNAKALINKGYALELGGSLKKAEQSFTQVIQLLENIKALIKEGMDNDEEAYRTWYINEFGQNGISVNLANNGLALTLLGKGEYEKAENILKEALKWDEWLRSMNPSYEQSSILFARDHHNLGEVYYRQEKFSRALKSYEASLDYIIRGHEGQKTGNLDLDNPHLYLSDKLYFLRSLLGKSKCYQAVNKHEGALECAHLGIDYIYRIRKNYQDISSRNLLADLMKGFTEIILDIHLQGPQPNIEQAFHFSEKSKIFTLLEAVRDHKSLEIAGVDKALLAEEKQLRIAIERINAQLNGQQDAEAKKELFSQLMIKKEALSNVLDQLSRQPNYQKLFVGMHPVGTHFIQKHLLAKGQAMIEYFIGRQNTYVFLIPKRGKIKYFTVPRQEEELAQVVDDFIYAILNSYSTSSGNPYSARLISDKSTLENLLLQSASSLFTDYLSPAIQQLSAQQLVIIPDGSFNKMPFSALVQPRAGTIAGAYHTYDYVGKSYDISYCYAATLLAEMQKPMQARPASLLAFAPSFQGQAAQTRLGLSRLHYNKQEVDAVCVYMSCEKAPFYGQEASKETFLELISQQPYNIIHLSTHGKADYSDPNNSYIAFSQMHPGRIDRDQFLFLRELYNLEMEVETVVLSSCETNLGPIHRAGGMLSLTRGFAFAGAKSIISSLWEVNEQATTELMKLFYSNLQKGMNKSRALQQAKVQLSQNSDYNHPYFWAAFIPVGKTHEISGRPSHMLYYGAGGLLLLLLFYRLRKSF